MAGGVLVEQCVEEDRARLADPALAVDERDLAEPCGAIVLGDTRTQRVRVLVGVDLNGAPSLEANAQASHDRPIDVERLGRRHNTLGPRRIGRREHLLGGRFGLKTTPSTSSSPEPRRRTATSAAARPSDRCRALEPQRVEPAASRRLPTACSSPTRSRHAAAAHPRPAAACRRAAPRASRARRRRRARDGRRAPTRRSPRERRTSWSSCVDHARDAPAASAAGRGRRPPGRRRPSARAGSSARPRCARRGRRRAARIRSGYHGGTNSRVSSAAASRADALDLRIEVPRVEEPRAVRVRLAATARISGAALGAPIIRTF